MSSGSEANPLYALASSATSSLKRNCYISPPPLPFSQIMSTKLVFNPLMTKASLWLLILLTFPYLSFADVPPAAPASSSNVCRSTPDPSYCKSVLPSNNSTANVYDYGRFSIQKSYNAARKFYALIAKYLRKPKLLTTGAVRALEDCLFLADLNIDFLLNTSVTVNGTSTILPTLEADDVQTILSAILTNTQTCLDGISDVASTWSVKKGITAPLANDTKLFSVSLALFTKGWVPTKQKLPRRPPINEHLRFGKGHLPLKMTERTRAVYETVSRRKLLQSSDDAVMINDIVIVSQDGLGNFTTINDAVAAAPRNSNASSGYFLIYITAGLYEEYVSIGKSQKYLLMIGDGINQTIISGNHSVVDGWTTFNSSTFAVVGQGFVAVNITFRNTAGASKHQAVAVRNGADLSTFYSCSFEGYQDTLYTHSLRQLYKECDIYGTIDFIFGNAAVVFQDCNMYARLPMSFQFNTVTAQGRTDPNQNTGISIQSCSVKAADDLASANVSIQTYLGRPWKLYSRTIFMQSFLDSLVDPTGWSVWNGDFALNTSYNAEFNNRGPGSNTSQRVTWPGFHIINATDAANFTIANFLLGDDWLWQTGVPYTSGLL